MAGRSRRDLAEFDLLVVGHTNIDRIYDVATLPSPDRTVPALEAKERLGGTAATIALSAAGFGVRTALSSLVGEDFPDEFRSELARRHVEISAVRAVAGQRTPSCLILEDGRGSQMTVIDQGAMGDASRAPVPSSQIARAAWVHLATGDPDYQLRVLAEARRLGRPVSSDPAQEVHYRWSPERLRRLVEGSEVLFGNSAEIEAIARRLGVDGPKGLVGIVPLVVVTEGPRGARSLSRAGDLTVGAGPRLRTRHVTGAGDAFRGGFYAGWFAGEDLRRCLGAGVRAARSWLAPGSALPPPPRTALTRRGRRR